jgi:hypothetical protein
LVDELVQRHGWLIGSAALVKALAFPSPAAFRQAAHRGKLPVRIFKIPGRKGQFALTTEVATWLDNVAARCFAGQEDAMPDD